MATRNIRIQKQGTRINTTSSVNLLDNLISNYDNEDDGIHVRQENGSVPESIATTELPFTDDGQEEIMLITLQQKTVMEE